MTLMRGMTRKPRISTPTLSEYGSTAAMYGDTEILSTALITSLRSFNA